MLIPDKTAARTAIAGAAVTLVATLVAIYIVSQFPCNSIGVIARNLAASLAVYARRFPSDRFAWKSGGNFLLIPVLTQIVDSIPPTSGPGRRRHDRDSSLLSRVAGTLMPSILVA